MTQASSEHLLELLICPECDAAVSAAARYCWLCGHAMDSPFKGRPMAGPFASPAGAPPAIVPSPADPSRDLALNVSLGVVALVLVLITAGVWMQEPAFGVALAFVLVPALAVTLISGLVSRASGKVMTPARRLLVFVKSVVVMFAVGAVTAAVAVIVAAFVIVGLIIALFEACFKMLGGG